MTVPFLKMHGLGNDFVVIDARARPLELSDAAIRAVADRRRGVGFDQLFVLEPACNGGDVFMRIFNADGSQVSSCGNGTRCVAALVMAERDADEARVETRAGVLDCRAAPGGLVTVDMGPARLDWRDIPVAAACDTLRMPVTVDGLGEPVGISMGNPHAVFFVEDAEAVPLAQLGPVLERHAFFPERANIEVAHLAASDRLRMRVWERGVGITQACGTGACATAVAAIRRGLTGRKVEVDLDGGRLAVEWTADNRVLMTGPTAVSFTGELPDALLAGAS
ncbi:MAG TPA: diaminopimelate epimerase [Alphaproteobacteria bacterium]|nr:diaminopimelate epimerase [Alphaproteobacteria bacterium]